MPELALEQDLKKESRIRKQRGSVNQQFQSINNFT